MARSSKPRANGPKAPNGKRSRSPRKGFGLLRFLRRLVVYAALASVALVLLLRWVPVPITPLMVIRCVEQAAEGRPLRLAKDWVALEDMSPHMVSAVVAAEDQLFFEHAGFDWDAILSAFSVNRRGARKLGASTISQQTAKNLFLWPARSWARKGLEAYFTLLLEALWPKRRILEVYLNVIETGDGAYGAEAASRGNFQVSSGRLSREQAALIAATLPNPRRWSASRPTAYLFKRQAWILRQMDYGGPLDWRNRP